ncbi:MAG: cupin domain-containing protein [Methylobacteriaceae bacterium]|nr:cupin domain-containing protein [Methylobacteriaceae bacterium]
MLSRRTFGGFVTCALCAISTGFTATEVAAQGTGAPPAATPGVTRKVLSQVDGPVPGYTTIIVEATIEPGVTVGRHTHPGIESGYVVEGTFELPIEGQKPVALKPGDGFQVPANTPHAGMKTDQKIKLTSTYVVEKGKPLASPA